MPESITALTPEQLGFHDIRRLIQQVHFEPEQGRIWLNDRRMVLLHLSGLGVMRRELIDSLGTEGARGLITRIGYNSGAQDAELARQLRSDDDPHGTVITGPQLHMLEGLVRVEPVRLEIDISHGHFLGEFHWHGSAEAEEHVRAYGIGTAPVCWMQIGYASGFASVFMGRPVLFREVQCSAQGAAHCHILGKPVEDWDDADDDLQYLRANSLTGGLSPPRGTALSVTPSSEAPTVQVLGDVDVVGVSAGFNACCHMVRRVADTLATVLFLGESGVGKEVLARGLHRISERATYPFVAVNCAAIPEDLIEAELFGVEKGAFTGALGSRPGRFERANQGTLFLDEIGILSWTAQGKLLRALQEREIERVGDSRTRKVDVRVVAATNLDLRAEVAAGRFREDLFYRLNVFPIRVPPLRERREDIPVFMNHFLRRFNARNGREVRGFKPRAIEALLTYGWPGNIRELENLVERGSILAPDGGAVDLPHLFSGGEAIPSRSLSPGLDGRLARDEVRDTIVEEPSTLLANEARLIREAVTAAGGNLAKAARRLGLTRAQLAYRARKHGISPP